MVLPIRECSLACLSLQHRLTELRVTTSQTKDKAKDIEGYVAFYKNKVQISE